MADRRGAARLGGDARSTDPRGAGAAARGGDRAVGRPGAVAGDAARGARGDRRLRHGGRCGRCLRARGRRLPAGLGAGRGPSRGDGRHASHRARSRSGAGPVRRARPGGRDRGADPGCRAGGGVFPAGGDRQPGGVARGRGRGRAPCPVRARRRDDRGDADRGPAAGDRPRRCRGRPDGGRGRRRDGRGSCAGGGRVAAAAQREGRPAACPPARERRVSQPLVVHESTLARRGGEAFCGAARRA